MSLSGRDSIDVRAFVRDLTYREVHAATWGVGLGAGTIIAAALVPPLTQWIGGAALGLLAYAFTGQDEVLGRFKRIANVERYVLHQVRQEPHYYIAGLGIGVVLAIVLLIAIPVL